MYSSPLACLYACPDFVDATRGMPSRPAGRRPGKPVHNPVETAAWDVAAAAFRATL